MTALVFSKDLVKNFKRFAIEQKFIVVVVFKYLCTIMLLISCTLCPHFEVSNVVTAAYVEFCHKNYARESGNKITCMEKIE
jgi:hypothetical protein